MAHIIPDGGEPIHLAYAPVNFKEAFDFDYREVKTRRFKLISGCILIFVFMASLVWYFLKLSRDNAQKSFE